MFCTKCGSQIPDGGVCPNCNPETQIPTEVTQMPPVETQETFVETQETFAQPEVQPVYPPMSAVKVRKGKYIAQLAPTSVKTFSLVGLIATILAIVFFVGCYFTFVNSSFEDIPIVDMAGVDMDEALDELKGSSDELDELIDKAEDDLDADDDFIDATKEVQDSVDELIDSFSLKNIEVFLDAAYEFNDVCEQYDEYDEDKMDTDVFDDLKTILNTINYVVIGFIAFCAIFTLFGGFFKKNGLVITGMIFSLIFTIGFCGMLFVILAAVLHIVLIVSNAVVNSSYKKYKKSLA